MKEEKIYELNDITIKKINNCINSYTIEVNLTTELSFSQLKKIKNKNVNFIIKSALADNKYYNNIDDKYRKRTMFNLCQTKRLIKAFERLDKMVDNHNNTFEKVLFIYKYILKNIKYDDTICFNKNGDDIRRTLYSLVTKKAVCSGFALIFYEALKRNGITNYYIHSPNHLYNVVLIDGKYYPLDVTWETVLKQKTNDYILHYFANYPLFEGTHKPLDGEEKFQLSYVDSSVIHNKNNKLKTDKHKRADGKYFYISQLPIGLGIKLYAIYDKCENLFSVITSKEDFSRVLTGRDTQLYECYINNLLASKRLKEKIKNNNACVGYGEIIDDIFYKHNAGKVNYPISQFVKDNCLEFNYNDKSYIITFKNNKFSFKEMIC